ncbi:putative fatty acyl-CoA reductase CG5065 [Oppia nitens]|uniref:putative fatty acyl-CoA reductase CG5065 n=1 Tax=Oppia nitens TaxID=1686743 RepID=UPI0023D97FC7|nr:putative fatty acyl-CoA reductase CG5065 [Oppia nitens]
MKLSQINQYYANRSVLITGGTGFIGKILCEKLIRSCPQIKTVYILLRPKPNQTIGQRLDTEIIGSEIFSHNITTNCPKILDKLVAIGGNICEPGLGLSTTDRQLLINEVSVVYHLAASVKFNESLDKLIDQNVWGTNEVMKLCDKMIKLEAVIYLSTAFSNCNMKIIGENVYKLKHTAVDTMAAIRTVGQTYGYSSDTLAMRELMDDRPNPYTFSKAIAENLVTEQYSHLPIVIVRPSIVTSVLKEPIPGWINNYNNGPTFFVLMLMMGIIRICEFLVDGKTDLIPVDILVNGLIVTAWHTANYPNDRHMVINMASSTINPITNRQFFDYLKPSIVSVPSHQMVRPVADILTKPIANKFQRLWYQLYRYFLINEWTIHAENYYKIYSRLSPEDQLTYYSDVRKIDWKSYICCLYLGVRRYQLREDDSNIDSARKLAIIKSIIILSGSANSSDGNNCVGNRTVREVSASSYTCFWPTGFQSDGTSGVSDKYTYDSS